MTEQKKSPFFKLKIFQKFKSIKHIEIILLIIFVSVILLIYFSSPKTNDNETSSFVTVSEYTSNLENKLKSVLSSINGAGKVNVMITVDGGIEYVYASTTEEKTNSNTSGNYETSSSTKTNTPVNGLIVKEILPNINGVVVVSSGARNTNVKLELLKATQMVLGVQNSKIEILEGN